VVPDAIPAALKALGHWVTWRYAWKGDRNPKWDKPPLQARGGGPAKSSDPGTWATFGEALAAYQEAHLDGIGFVVHKGEGHADRFVVFDLDACRDPDTGAIEPWGVQVVRAMDSYTEVSPSGTGLRVIAIGALPPGRRRWGPFEVYDNGRYVTITGHHLPGTPTDIRERQAAINHLHAAVFPGRSATEPPPAATGAAVLEDDDELVQRAFRAKNGGKFAALWQGEVGTYASPSEADLALCSALAFWTGPDADRIDRLFRRSRLYRSKWERPDYRQRTIAKALEGYTTFYSGESMPAAAKNPKPAPTLVICDATLESEALDYLIPDILARGKLSVLYGQRDCNKSTRAQQWAVELSVQKLPVLYLSSEEGWQDTVLPRLRAMGANFDYLTVLKGSMVQDGAETYFVLSAEGMRALESLVETKKAALIVLDVVFSVLPDRLNADKQQDVRKLLFDLKMFAEKHKLAILAVAHTNKDPEQDARDRMSGSTAWSDAPRFVYLMMRDPDDRENGQRYLVPNKANHLKDEDSVATLFEVKSIPALKKDGSQLHDSAGNPVTVPMLHELGVTEETFDSLCDPDRQKKKDKEGAHNARPRSEAMKFLVGALAWGPKAAKQILAKALGAGIAKATLARAKKELNIESKECSNGDGKHWYWSLPSLPAGDA
jgi:hypothetical protein